MAGLDASSSFASSPANSSSSIGPFGALDTSDPLFHICWRRQSCASCLAGDVACSWCPISSTCVPNQARLPIFAPISSENICPLGYKERWELRAVPFGCNASTLTVLAVVIAVLGSLALLGLGLLIFKLVQRLRRRWKESDYERLQDQQQDSAWSACLDCGMLASLLSLHGGPSQGQNTDQDQLEVERGDEAETRPLLQ